MWSALTRDFNELAQNFRKDSLGFVDLLGKIAADVVGEGGIYAGDEVTPEASEMPLDSEILLEFQASDDTYCTALSADEEALFLKWEVASPLSSVNVQKRVAAAAAKRRVGDASLRGDAAVWPDEPADESRQRLLDYSEAVLAKYTALVGEAVSPRASPQGSPVHVGDRTPVLATTTYTTTTTTTTTTTPATADEPDSTCAATPVKPPTRSAHGCLSEDVFFDRYFFRLAQLRAYCAARRRESAEEAAKATASADRREKEAASTAADVRDVGNDDDNDNDDNDGDSSSQVPAFARKLMAAANGFVTNLDVALTGGASPTRDDDDNDDGSDADNVTPPNALASVERVSPKKEAENVGALERVVQELQTALRREQGRVQQLTALLEEHAVALPPYPPRANLSSPLRQPTAAAAAAEDMTTQTATTATAMAEKEQPATRHTSSASAEDDWEKISDK